MAAERHEVGVPLLDDCFVPSGSKPPAAMILLLGADDMRSPLRDELGQVKTT